MENVEVLGLTVNLFGQCEDTPDLGAVYLSYEGREYILDVVQSYTDTNSGDTEIDCDLEIDRDTFEDCPYDLTQYDLMASRLEATFYIATELEIDKLSLFVKIGDMTKVIDLRQD